MRYWLPFFLYVYVYTIYSVHYREYTPLCRAVIKNFSGDYIADHGRGPRSIITQRIKIVFGCARRLF